MGGLMKKLFNKMIGSVVSFIFLLNMTSVGYAETTVSAEVGFIFNTFLFLVCGFLVMFMAAGFGTYKVAKRKARIGRNPRTGEQIQIAASQKVKFLPAKALKEIFNK